MAKIHPIIHPILIPIIDCYPQARGIVCDLFRQNESFHEICLDYEQCRKTLLYWRTQDSEEAIMRIAEYEDLLRSLELEILQYLADCDSVIRRGNAG